MSLLFLSVAAPARPGAPVEDVMEGTFVDLAAPADFFLENAGQLRNDEVRFYAKAGLMQAGFAESAVLIRTSERAPSHPAGAQPQVWAPGRLPPPEAAPLPSVTLRLEFAGANSVMPKGSNPLPHPTNFFFGDDPTGWRRGVRSYGEITYENLYAGIDLVYRTGPNGLKYDFLVDPGADPDRIRMVYEGIESLDLSPDRLVLRTSIGEIRDEGLVAAAGGEPVQCAFARAGIRAAGFVCEGWSREHTLVIDPLLWATFLGASREEEAQALALDSAGNPVVGGWTYSADFPTTPGAYDVTFNGGYTDAFVAKMSADGSSLLWATFLGGGTGDGNDAIFGLALDGSGRISLGGSTYASDFPATAGAYDTTHNGAADAFVAKLSANGSLLLWATYLGGGDADHAWTLSQDGSGDLLVGGETRSTNFPATTGAYDRALNGLEDAFVAKLSADGSSLLWATYLGGSGSAEDEPWAISLDSAGNPVVAGMTYCPDFPTTAGAYDTTYGGGFTDGFVAKLSGDGSSLLWSTFLGGGSGDGDMVSSLARDRSGDFVVAGRTLSSDFPTTPGAYDVTYNGDGDSFVATLSDDGTTLLWSTFLGGRLGDEGVSKVVLNGAGHPVVAGATGASDYPTTADAFDTTFNGFVDAFVAELNANGSALLWSSFLGGTNAEQALDLDLDASGDAVVAGRADSANFPVTPGAYDTTLNGAYEAFLAKLSLTSGQGNQAPRILSFDAGASTEGGVVVFTATADDPDGDPLTYSFDFQADGAWDRVGPSDTATYVWGDDHIGAARVRVSDGTLSSLATTAVTVANVSPVLETTVIPAGNEADSLTFSARVTDPGSDDLRFAWSGDCIGWSGPRTYWNDPAIQPDPAESPDIHSRDLTDSQTVECGDDGPLHWGLTLTDDDGGTTVVSGTFSVSNLPPSLTVAPPSLVTLDEGARVTLSAAVEDPGSDDLTFTWSWQYGPTETCTYYNDGIGPDPHPSPNGTYPFAASDSSSFTYGDDGMYFVTLTVADDDGGSLTYATLVQVNNVAPSVDAGADAATDEGSPIAFTFSFQDPGFDQAAAGTVEDFTATVDWGDGTSEPLAVMESSGGPGVPTSGTMDGTHIFADNGVYTVTVTVCDDDGGCATDSLAVDVANVAPTVDAGSDVAVDERTALAFTFSFSDPGFDFPPAGTVEDFTAYVDWGYGAPEAPAVREMPGAPGIPTAGMVSLTHTYGDNGAFTVTVTLCDDDGGCSSDTMVVTVGNVDPVIDDVQIYVLADLRLRVAGEKWHDVRMDLTWNDGVTGTASVTRFPGSPDDQSTTLEGGRIQLLGDFSITLHYTPDDDPVNGQPNGANPTWVILTMPDGSEVRLHHTFNVQHPATWTWTLDDFQPYLVGQDVTFEASASDVGSDDLTFAWDLGDGASAIATYFNDGVGPDPFPSPEVKPITATDVATHAYLAAGTYVITLTLTDDDGGTTFGTFMLVVGS